MSNHNSDEISEHRKPKVSLAMKISQGLGGPKAKPKGEADGQPVNIPAPLHFFNRVTKSSRWSALLDSRCQSKIFQGLMGSSVSAE